MAVIVRPSFGPRRPGYREEGTTMAPFGTVGFDALDRLEVASDTIGRALKVGLLPILHLVLLLLPLLRGRLAP